MPVYTHPSTDYPLLPWIDTNPIDPAIIENPGEWAFTLSDGTEVHVHGTGFDWDIDGEPSAGTVDTITRTTSGGGTVIEQLTGNGGGSLGIAFASLNTEGEGLGPVFNILLSGADTITGNTGHDALYGGPGGDVLDGGADDGDIADYIAATAAVTADLFNTGNNLGDALGDTYISIEGLRGSAFNDSLRGDGGDNSLFGEGGNDFLRGRGGADELHGGAGGDWADYQGAAAAVTVNLGNAALNTGDAAGDTFDSIEHIRGSDNNDTLTGDGNENFLRGGLGADALNGGANNDWADYRGSAGGLTVDLSNYHEQHRRGHRRYVRFDQPHPWQRLC